MKLRIANLRLPSPEADLHLEAGRKLRLPPEEILDLEIVKSSVDARGRRPVRVVNLNVEVKDPEGTLARLAGDRQVMAAPPPKDGLYEGPRRPIGAQPVVVGTGPAGMFVTLALLEKGFRPLVIERGKPVRPRWKDVNAYWNQGKLDPESNVVFGDGGAGTFSDGKLYTRRNDPRNPHILSVLAELGKAPDVLVEGKPHLGTNRLSRALLNFHERLRAEGVEVRFGHRLEDLVIEGGRVRGVVVNGERIGTDAVFLATGHSARDVYRMLLAREVAMEARPFAIGSRAEHPQALINRAQLGTEAPDLAPADYMLSFNDARRHRSAYTFCMCPGGEVVGAGTEPDGLTVNGMSYSNRADRFGNAAVVVTVSPEDYGGEGPLAGVEFQMRLEKAAYEAGGGGHVAPAQRIVDFLEGRATEGALETSYRRGTRGADLTKLLPDDVVTMVQRALRRFGRLVQGYDGPEGVLIGLETRTSSPVRVLRDADTYESVSVGGLYPVGEGAGYAGGIMSSASDGLRAVERVEAMVPVS
jgi:uncharacterized FAD-dependent dehydrogenase